MSVTIYVAYMFWGALQLSSALATLFFYKLTKSPFAHGPPQSGSSHSCTTLTQNGSLRVLFFCPFLPASVEGGDREPPLLPGTVSSGCFCSHCYFLPPLSCHPPQPWNSLPVHPAHSHLHRRAFRAQLKSHVSRKDFRPPQVPSRELFLGRMGAV